MSSSVQMGAATVGTAGAVAAGGYGVSQIISSENAITYQPVCITFDPNTQLKTPYANALLSVTKEENLYFLAKPIEENRSFWEWALTTKYNSKIEAEKHSIFENLTTGFSEDEENNKALNQACNSAYKASISEYKIDEGILLKNIGDFCTKGFESVDISEPKAYSFGANDASSEDYQHGLLSIPRNKPKLVKKEGTNHNDLWWEWAYKNLFEEYESKSGSHFEHITKGFSDNPVSQNENEIALNQACDSAYKKDKIELEKSDFKLFQEVAMFCSYIRPEVSLNSPFEPYFALLSNSSKASQYNKGLANEEGNKNKLLDPEEPKNQNWFEWAYNTYLAVITNKTTELPAVFQKVSKGWSDSPETTAGSQIALNQACKETYDKNKSELSKKQNVKPVTPLVKKFCSPKKIKESLATPSK